MSTPKIEITVDATVDAAWQALRDTATIHRWHGWDTDEITQEIESIYFTDVTVDDQAHMLVANGGDRFEVHALPSGVSVTLTRAPLSGDPDWDAYYDDVTEGWTSFLQQLRFLLAHDPTATRRTLHFADRHVHSGTVADRLGLGDIAAASAGNAYAATIAGGEATGEVWFRSAHQLGLTVDAWGPGLLILAGTTPSQVDPTGNAMAILSTYDLDDVAFGRLSEQWSAWWAAHTH
ncbi:SRPBCC family protein [Salinispora arenicola]|uniref:SRPBCC family protein n=1 Tax=Salinispora arenicola TaxID=168697 RepID=UPI0003707A47|nr:hypothetical protein [Salinispora arenicola]